MYFILLNIIYGYDVSNYTIILKNVWFIILLRNVAILLYSNWQLIFESNENIQFVLNMLNLFYYVMIKFTIDWIVKLKFKCLIK